MKSILVADTEPAILRALRMVLECQECRVITTSSVDDTLTVLSYFKPNLILAEYELGLQAIKRLEARKQKVPAPLLLIAEGDKAKESPEWELLERPFEVKQLIDKVTELLGSTCPSE